MSAKDRVQSWASLLLGAAVVALASWLTYGQLSNTHVRAEWDGGAAEGGAVVLGDGGTGTGASTGNGTSASAGSGDGGFALGALGSGDGGFALGSLDSLLDSGAMPTNAALRAVRLGVVLVQFAGAEGAPSNARAKPDALKHAHELLGQARTDWKAAVKSGDSGSSEDIGRIPRGVLDRATELAVFNLDKDAISEPLETPRGYWIVKRVE